MGEAPLNPYYRAMYRMEAPEGPIELECPHVLGPESVAELEELLAIILRGLKRRAAKIAQGKAVDDAPIHP